MILFTPVVNISKIQYQKGKRNKWSLRTLSASWLHRDPPHLLGTKNRARKSLLDFYCCSFVLFCLAITKPSKWNGCAFNTFFFTFFPVLSWLYWCVSHLLDLSAFVWQPRMDHRQWLAAARPPHLVLSFNSQHMHPTTQQLSPARVLWLWAGEPSSSLSHVQANLRETAEALKPFV